ncbi:class I SAM-dependent rRNA methyltransferase [Halalkalibacter urbisdiaboli]|uniref:class I SAM-dependent rRNA methyltransferase n=1 Tax=Halalkalibacter urbisdiaboli TaxID=1960589 RepID=UPI000B43A37B|nr:class I SAM-dependent rRNA methyltransferase [Halalkalibacter urbisdiaboli]
MRKEIRLTVKKPYIQKFKKGFPLIEKDAITNMELVKEEGSLIRLEDQQQQFIGKGYVGKQNKGIGWILSNYEHEPIDKTFFLNRIQLALEKRSSLFEDPETTAFRVFNGEGDGIGGLTIDYYDGFYVMTWYSEGIFAFREWVIEAFGTVPFKGIYEKKRFDQKGKYIDDDDFVIGERGTFPLLVKENGITFAVYLNDGPMVGVFLDQREVRKRIRDDYANGKKVLNTFSYTGAFSVAAALGGATKTTSVDLANRSLAKTIEQFSVNGIDYESQDIVVMDVFRYFNYAQKKGLSFDLVILDPPSFARSKKHTFRAEKDYTNLIKETIAITEDEGVIVASTNCSTFGMKKFLGFIEAAFRETGNRFDILETFSLPDDFQTMKEYQAGDYLKVVFVKKSK